MKKKKRGKYPKRRVLSTHDPQLMADFYAATDDQAPLAGRQLAAGTIQHPDTGLYQVWLSTNGLDVTCLAAYRELEQADTSLEGLKAFLRTPAVYDADTCAAFFQKLLAASDVEPRALPDELVRQIARGILRRVADGPRS